MGEVHHHDNEDEYLRSELALLQFSDANFKSPLSLSPIPLSPSLFIHTHDEQNTNSGSESDPASSQSDQHVHPKDEWLPITESRNGNAYYAAFHILNSNIGFQALMLPVAFATLGWYVILFLASKTL
ncbi:lysine histidine transporter [Trifolium repens]|nr:lysine histidine transporter [Trifolium repens]